MVNRAILYGRPTFPTCQGDFPESVHAPMATTPPTAFPQTCPYRLQLVCPEVSSVLGSCHLPSFSILQISPFSVCTALLIYVTPTIHWDPHKADCLCPYSASLLVILNSPWESLKGQYCSLFVLGLKRLAWAFPALSHCSNQAANGTYSLPVPTCLHLPLRGKSPLCPQFWGLLSWPSQPNYKRQLAREEPGFVESMFTRKPEEMKYTNLVFVWISDKGQKGESVEE